MRGWITRPLNFVLIGLFLEPTFSPHNEAHAGSSVPIAFERGYRNNAWGYQNYGCFVDLQRHIYTYNESKPEPIKNIGRVPPAEYQKAWLLMQSLVKAPFVPGTKTRDGGVLTWSAFNDGHVLLIKRAGDVAEKRDSPHLLEMINLLNSWCPKSMLPSLPE